MKKLLTQPKQLDLTKREYFAGLVLQGLLANDVTSGTHEYFVKKSIEFADIMIEKLNTHEK